MNIKCINYK